MAGEHAATAKLAVSACTPLSPAASAADTAVASSPTGANAAATAPVCSAADPTAAWRGQAPLRWIELHLVQLHVGQCLCAGDAHGCLMQPHVQLQLWGCELSQG